MNGLAEKNTKILYLRNNIESNVLFSMKFRNLMKSDISLHYSHVHQHSIVGI